MARALVRLLAAATVMAVACTNPGEVCGCTPPPASVVVKGRVTDAAGAPVAGARLALDLVPATMSADPYLYFIEPVTTASDGAFVARAYTDFGPGEMSLRAGVVRAGTTDTVRVRLAPTVDFTGQRNPPDIVDVVVALP